MAQVINPESAYAKEMAKHEQHRTKYVSDEGPGPGNPYSFRPYPKLLYKARLNPQTGKGSVGEVYPSSSDYNTPQEYERRLLFVESFNASCQKKVLSEDQDLVAHGQGWHDKQDDALRGYESEQIAIGNAAAEAAFAASRMSSRAQTEYAAAEASSEHHVTDVVGTKKGPKYVAPADRA